MSATDLFEELLISFLFFVSFVSIIAAVGIKLSVRHNRKFIFLLRISFWATLKSTCGFYVIFGLYAIITHDVDVQGFIPRIIEFATLVSIGLLIRKDLKKSPIIL